MMNNEFQQKIDQLILKIQKGFGPEDSELLKSVYSHSALLWSLIKLTTIRARKRTILRTLNYSIFIWLIIAFVCFTMTYIVLASEDTYKFTSLSDSLFRYSFFILFLIGFFKSLKVIWGKFKIKNAVLYVDEFDIPTAEFKLDQKIEQLQKKNYKSKHRHEAILQRKFAKDRQKIRIAGAVLTILSIGLLFYCFQLPPNKLHRITIILPFFLMIGIGMIMSPQISGKELKHLYGSETPSFKFLPKPFKICLILSFVLCILMDCYRNGLFTT